MPEECDGIEQCCDGTWFQYAPCCPEPEVSAGVDQEIQGLEGAFAGQANNYDSLLWTQISGPEVSISDNTSFISGFTFSEAGTAIFELTATNACGSVNDRVTIISISPGNYDVQWEILSDSSHNVIQIPEPYNLDNETGSAYGALNIYNDSSVLDFYGLARLIITARGNFTVSAETVLALAGVTSFSGEYIARVYYIKNADPLVELGQAVTSSGSAGGVVEVDLTVVDGDMLSIYFEISSDAWQEGDSGNAQIDFGVGSFSINPT